MASNDCGSDLKALSNLNSQLRKLLAKAKGGPDNGPSPPAELPLKDCSSCCAASMEDKKPVMQASDTAVKTPNLTAVSPAKTSTEPKPAVSSKTKIVTGEPVVVPGTSSRTAPSELEDEPFGMASRWTAEEREGRRMVRKGLAGDEEEGWVVI